MIDFKKLFQEFFILYYKEINPYYNTLKDIKISDYIIMRFFEDNCNIIYLYSGSFLSISKKWIDLFTSFSSYYSNIDFFKEDINDCVDNIDKLGILFSRLCICINNNLSIIDEKEFLELLGEIYQIKTKDFSSWIEENFEIILSPIKYITLSNDLEI